MSGGVRAHEEVVGAERGRSAAVVLLSGGLDSATCLAWATRRYGRVVGLSFDYGQRHASELAAAARVAAAMGVDRHVVVKIDLRAIGGSALTDGAIDVPKCGDGVADRASEDDGRSASVVETDRSLTVAARKTSDERSERSVTVAGRKKLLADGVDVGASGIPVTYVPARNMLFLSVGVGLAEVEGAGAVVIGVNAVDYSGYPDCRPAFIEAFARAANLGTKRGVESSDGIGVVIETPIIGMRKCEIIGLGASLGVDYSMTVSCYDATAEGLACGRCDSCVIRARAFGEAGVDDPTRYAAEGGR